MKNISKVITILGTAFILGSCASSGNMNSHGLYGGKSYCKEDTKVKGHGYHPKNCNFRQKKGKMANFGPKSFLEGKNSGRLYKK